MHAQLCFDNSRLSLGFCAIYIQIYSLPLRLSSTVYSTENEKLNMVLSCSLLAPLLSFTVFFCCFFLVSKKMQPTENQLDDIAIDEFRFTHPYPLRWRSLCERKKQKQIKGSGLAIFRQLLALNEEDKSYCGSQHCAPFHLKAINDVFNWLRLENICCLIYAVFMRLFICIHRLCTLINDSRRRGEIQ